METNNNKAVSESDTPQSRNVIPEPEPDDRSISSLGIHMSPVEDPPRYAVEKPGLLEGITDFSVSWSPWQIRNTIATPEREDKD